MSKGNRITVRFSDLELAKVKELSEQSQLKTSVFIRQCIMDQIDLIEASTESSDDMNFFESALEKQKQDILIILEESMRLIYYLLPELQDKNYAEANKRSEKRLDILRNHLTERFKNERS